jgi:hypothetical protein
LRFWGLNQVGEQEVVDYFMSNQKWTKLGIWYERQMYNMLYVGIVCATGMLANRKQVLDSVTNRNSGWMALVVPFNNEKNVDLHLQQFKVHSNPFNMFWTPLTIFTNPNMFLKSLQNSNPGWHLLLKWPLLLPVQATSSDCPATLTSWWNAEDHMRHKLGTGTFYGATWGPSKTKSAFWTHQMPNGCRILL